MGITETDVLKRLYRNEVVVLPDGTHINPLDPSFCCASADVPKRVAILGDTNDARSMKTLLKDCDVLVHESTIAPLSSEHITEKEVVQNGHSTIAMACAFGKECGAKRLLLNHISSRYTRRDEEEMKKIAVDSFGSENVVLTHDFFCESVFSSVCHKHDNHTEYRGREGSKNARLPSKTRSKSYCSPPRRTRAPPHTPRASPRGIPRSHRTQGSFDRRRRRQRNVRPASGTDRPPSPGGSPASPRTRRSSATTDESRGPWRPSTPRRSPCPRRRARV